MQSENTAIYESQSDEQERRTCANAEEIGSVRHYNQEGDGGARGEKEESECAIYCFHHIETGRKYIGSSNNPSARRKGHLALANSGSKNFFHRHLREYGIESFIWGIIEYCTKTNRLEREGYWIREFNAVEYGFNTQKDPTKGPPCAFDEATGKRSGAARRGRKRSRESVEKTASALRGRKRSPEQCEKNSKARLGKKRSLESRLKQSATLTGRKKSAAHIEKVAAWHRGKKRSPEICAKMIGRKMSEEAIAKSVAARRGFRWSEEQRAKMRGRIPSIEERAKMSAAGRGRKKSPEHLEKISQALRGKKLSPEACEKMKAAWVIRRARSAAASAQACLSLEYRTDNPFATE